MDGRRRDELVRHVDPDAIALDGATPLESLCAFYGLPVPAESQIGLALRILCGFGIDEIANANGTITVSLLNDIGLGALYSEEAVANGVTTEKADLTFASLAPAVLWIDEIEKAFASAASQSTDGGLSQRMARRSSESERWEPRLSRQSW